jgi:DNA invertase Pin-like site-specific DNA recombinase
VDGKSRDEGGARPKVIAYIRASTSGQGERGVGLKSQRDGTHDFAKCMGYEVVEDFPEIASARGENNLAKRPMLFRALDEAKRLGAVLVVYDWTRLTRHEPDLNTIHAHLPADRIVSVEDAENLAGLQKRGGLPTARPREKQFPAQRVRA